MYRVSVFLTESSVMEYAVFDLFVVDITYLNDHSTWQDEGLLMSILYTWYCLDADDADFF